MEVLIAIDLLKMENKGIFSHQTMTDSGIGGEKGRRFSTIILILKVYLLGMLAAAPLDP